MLTKGGIRNSDGVSWCHRRVCPSGTPAAVFICVQAATITSTLLTPLHVTILIHVWYFSGNAALMTVVYTVLLVGKQERE